MAVNGTDLNNLNGVPLNKLGNNSNENPVAGGELGKDAFLQLLITQMQYQDPLDPQDNSEWISQLAQFSALSAMTDVADGMALLNQTLGTMNSSMLVGQLNAMIGQDIRWTTKETDKDGNTVETVHTGKVTSVKMESGKVSVLAKEYDDDGNLTDKVTKVDTKLIEGIGDLKDLKDAIAKEDEEKEEKNN